MKQKMTKQQISNFNSIKENGLRFSGATILATILMLGAGLGPGLGITELTVNAQGTGGRSRQRTSASQVLPRGTEMKIRLETTIDTKEAKVNDLFTATVLTPASFAGAIVEGHIDRVKSSGKVTGTTELTLTFDLLRFRSGQTRPFAAQVVMIGDESSAKNVDDEGTVKSGSQGKTTAVRTAGGAAIGAIIGAIAGGGKGAAIGAAVGGAAGAGSVLIQGSKKIKLEAGTEILVRTTR